MISCWIVCGALLGAGADSGSAPAAGGLSLARALDRALRQNPGLSVLQADEEAAEGAKASAQGVPNPGLGVGPGIRTGSGKAAFHGEFSVSQVIEFPGKRALRVALADGDLRLRKWAASGFRQQLAIGVTRAFHAALVAAKIAALREEQVASAEAFLNSARQRVQAGYASDFEPLKAQADWIAARKAKAEAMGREREAKLAMAAWMGAPLDTAFRMEGDLDSMLQAPLPDDPVALALAENPGLKAQSLQAGLAAKRIEAARMDFRPDLTLSPSLEYTQDERIIGINASLPLPIWNRGRGAVQAARAEALKSKAETERLRQDIIASVTSALAKLRLAESQLGLYTPAFLADLRDIKERAEKVYGQGATTFLVYLEARRSYYETLADYYQSLGNRGDCRLDLEAAIGAPDATVYEPGGP